MLCLSHIRYGSYSRTATQQMKRDNLCIQTIEDRVVEGSIELI
jgi:hypothetical protein